MKANPEDRVKAGTQSKRFPLPHLLVALGILAAVLWFSYSGSRDKPAPPIAVPDELPEIVEPEPLPAPDIPEPATPEPVVLEEEAPLAVVTAPPLPPLEASDEALREQLSSIAAQPQLEKLLRSDWAIHRGGAVFIEGAEDCTLERCFFNAVGAAVPRISFAATAPASSRAGIQNQGWANQWRLGRCSLGVFHH